MKDRWYFEQLKSTYLVNSASPIKPKIKKSANVFINDSPFFGERVPIFGEKEIYVNEGNFCDLNYLESQLKYMEKINNNKLLRDEIMSAQTTQFFMPGFKKDEEINSLPRLCKKYTVLKFIYSQ
jgi:hypothetical protein